MPATEGSNLSSADMCVWVWGRVSGAWACQKEAKGHVSGGFGAGVWSMESSSCRDPTMLQGCVFGGWVLEGTGSSWREGPGNDQVGAQGSI